MTNGNNDYHTPVLLKESLYYLDILPGEKYIDCTLGGGGHTAAIIEGGAIVLGIDQDTQALAHVEKKGQSAISNGQLILKHGNFAHLQEIANEAGFGKVSGILFDLGVSSHQLESADRGFSFKKGPQSKLDMRMDPSNQAVTAADLVNAAAESELANLFWQYGEERAAKKIAGAIVNFRKTKKIEFTDELADIILRVRGKGSNDRTNPATRVFQALRIAVNDELTSLENVLPQAVNLLRPGGRLVIISFHSLEDRIIKNFMRANTHSLTILTDKPIMASPEEVARNPRARSAKLRAAEKTKIN